MFEKFKKIPTSAIIGIVSIGLFFLILAVFVSWKFVFAPIFMFLGGMFDPVFLKGERDALDADQIDHVVNRVFEAIDQVEMEKKKKLYDRLHEIEKGDNRAERTEKKEVRTMTGQDLIQSMDRDAKSLLDE
jgi:hypothetical protein